MAAGTPKAKLHDRMNDVLELLAQYAEASYKAAIGEEQPTWFVPSADDWSGDPLDVKGTTAAFNRDEINENYRDAHSTSGEGTVSDSIALKLQIDWVGALERSYRMRHASAARCAFAAAGRLCGHGNEKGIFLGGVRNHIVDILQQGAGPKTEPSEAEEQAAAEARGVLFEDQA